MALFRRDVLQNAERLVSKGKVEGAIKEYRKYLDKSPDDTSTLNRVGDLYARVHKNDEAVRYYKQTAERYAADGFYVKAIAVYKKIHRIEPGRLAVHERLAELYRRQGLVSDARGHYQQLVDHYLRDDDPAAAVAVYAKLVDLEPENPSHWLRLADLHRGQGQLGEALRAYGSIAALMLSHEQTAHAFQVYERAFQVDPGDLDFVAEAITAMRSVGGEAKAGELLRLAVAHNPQAQELEGLLLSTPAPPTQSAEPAPPEVAESVDDRAKREPEDEPVAPELASFEPADSESQSASVVREATQEEAAGGASPASGSGSGEWAFEPEPELDDIDLEFDLDPVADLGALSDADDEFELIEEPSVAGRARPQGSAADKQVAPLSRESELLTEADVFLKYGLVEKAKDRLHQVLESDPTNVAALRRLVSIHLEGGEHSNAATRASELHEADVAGRNEAWAEVEPQLLEHGYRVIAGKVVAPEPALERDHDQPAAEVSPGDADESTEIPLGDLEIEPFVPPAQAVEVEVSELQVSSEETAVPKAEPAVPEAEPAVPQLEQDVSRDVESLGSALVEDTGSLPAAEGAETASAATPAPRDAAPDWLEQVDARAVEEAGQQLFSDEDAFFDLAAELQDVLADGGPSAGDGTRHELGEQSIEEIVAGFKKGVAENIGEEESDTHYNLGIAYREMLLLDEAIGEFQISAKDSAYQVDSFAMLGLCFGDKGLPDLAVKWYRRALDTEGLEEERRHGMLYDLGVAHEANGDPQSACEVYREIHDAHNDYRDVAGKLEELQAGATEP